MHEHHAASVIAPDTAAEALHPANLQLFGQGVEGFGNNVAGDAFTRQRRRHVRRWQHQQINLIRRQNAAGRLAHRHKSVIAKQLLHDHVMNRVPERNRRRLPAQLLDLGNARGYGQARAADMVPGHDFGRDLAAITSPDRHRRQQVNHVDLPGNERFDHLGPTAQQHRSFSLDAFGFEQAVVMGHQQGRGIGDRQVSDPHRGIGL